MRGDGDAPPLFEACALSISVPGMRRRGARDVDVAPPTIAEMLPALRRRRGGGREVTVEVRGFRYGIDAWLARQYAAIRSGHQPAGYEELLAVAPLVDLDAPPRARWYTPTVAEMLPALQNRNGRATAVFVRGRNVNVSAWVSRQHAAIRAGRPPANHEALLAVAPMPPSPLERWTARVDSALRRRNPYRAGSWLDRQCALWRDGELSPEYVAVLEARGVRRDPPEVRRVVAQTEVTTQWLTKFARAVAGDNADVWLRSWRPKVAAGGAHDALLTRARDDPRAAIGDAFARWCAMVAIDDDWRARYDAIEQYTRPLSFDDCLLREWWFPMPTQELAAWVRTEHALHRQYATWRAARNVVGLDYAAPQIAERFHRVEQLNAWRWRK